jgi:NADH dehydrogenase
MHPRIIKIAEKRLKKLRVKVHTQSRIASIAKHEAIFTDGSTIPFDFMIFAGGTTTTPCLETFNAEKNKKGQIIVDAYLKSNTYGDIYVIGDTAALKTKKGKPLPPTAQTAIQSGEIAAKNIICSLHGKALKKANMHIKGIAIALGGKYAAIDLGFIHFHGYPAYLVKKLIERLYKWPLWWFASKGFTKLNSCEI